MEAVTRRIFQTICCICQRQKGKHGWERKAVPPRADLSHGYCPDCYQKVMIQYGLGSVFDRRPELHENKAVG